MADAGSNAAILNSPDFYSEGPYAGMSLAEEAAARKVALNVVRRDRRLEQDSRAVTAAASGAGDSLTDIINASLGAQSVGATGAGAGARIGAANTAKQFNQHEAVLAEAARLGKEPVVQNADGTISVLNTGYEPGKMYQDELNTAFDGLYKVANEGAPGEYTTYEYAPPENSAGEALFKGAVMAAIGAGTGAAGAGMLGLGGGAAGSALGNAASSAIGTTVNQALTTGSIDPAAVLKSAAMGGVGGYFKDLVSGATSTVGSAVDNAIWDISGATGLDYDTVSGVLSGAASGAIGGRDVESILKGAAGGIASNYAQGALIDQLGGSFDVANLFDDGNTNVDTAALFPVVDTAINAAISGDLSAGDVLGAGRDYLSEGGSLGFLDPGLDNPLIGSNFAFNLPDLGYIDDTYLQPIKDAAVAAGDVVNDTVIQPAGDVLASFDDAVLQPIKDALPQGTTPNIDLPDANLPSVDLPDVNLPSVDLPSIDLASGGSAQSTSSVSDKEWSDLFAYTTITPYQKKQLAPYVDYIKQARGMLS